MTTLDDRDQASGRLNPEANPYFPFPRGFPVYPWAPPPFPWYFQSLHPLPPPPLLVLPPPTTALVSPGYNGYIPVGYSDSAPTAVMGEEPPAAMEDNHNNGSGRILVEKMTGGARHGWRRMSSSSSSRVRKGPRSKAKRVLKPKVTAASTPCYPIGNVTTVMIKNIPNRMRRSELLILLEEHCREANKSSNIMSLSEFDFVYLPMDFKTHANVGYAFVNFTTVEGAAQLYNAWNRQQWQKYGYFSKKVRVITQAKIQGTKANKIKYMRTTFECYDHEYLPVELNPPCNGFNCSMLVTIGRRRN